LKLKLKDGRELTIEEHDYEGAPTRPLSKEQLRAKFMKLTSGTKAYNPAANGQTAGLKRKKRPFFGHFSLIGLGA